MATFLLKKHPELLLGGDPVGPVAYKRCYTFWERFHNTQPNHAVYTRFTSTDLGNVIPVCIHGDEGRTLRKPPISVYSFETVFGLPEKLRDCAVEPGERNVVNKYVEGRLSQTCGERRAAGFVPRPTLDPNGTCTVARQHSSTEPLQMHNALGDFGFS